MRFTIIFIIFVLGLQARAGLYIEPYVGYMEGTAKESESFTVLGQTVSASGQGNEHGVVYGGKLGLSFLGLAFGADYMAGTPNNSGGQSGPTSALSDIGAFVGFTFPVFMKVSASYFFSSQVTNVSETDANSVTTYATAKGNGFKITLGFTFLPLIAINLDYISHTWNNIPMASTITALSASDSGGMLGISLPLSL